MKRALSSLCAFALLILSSGPIAAQRSTESDLLRQLQQSSTAFAASLDLATLYRGQGRTDDAIRMLERALNILRSEQSKPPPPLPPGVPLRIGGDIKPPRKTKNVDPIYPDSARAAQLSGAVKVEFTIDTTGKVGNVRVLQSSPPFDEAAVQAVEQWRYEPTLLNGIAVRIIATAVVRFSP